MKRLFILFLFIIITTVFITDYSLADAVYVGSKTISLLQSSFNTNGQENSYAPLYEYLSLSSQDTYIKGLDIQFYGWGKLLTGQPFTYENNDAEIEYGYISYKTQDNLFKAILGRQLLFDGVAQGNIDGLKLESDLPIGVALDVFAGKPVVYGLSPTSHFLSNAFLYGGRIGYQMPWKSEISTSYMQIKQDGVVTQKNIGANVYVMPIDLIQVMGRLFYSTIFKEVYEGNLTAMLFPIEHIKLSLYGETNDPKALLGYGSIIGTFASKYNDYGINIDYALPSDFYAGGSYAYYFMNDARAEKYGVSLKKSWNLYGLNTIGLSYEQLLYIRGLSNGYYLLRVFFEKQLNSLLLSADYIHSIYDQYILNYNGSDNLTATLSYQIKKYLSLSGALFYAIDPRYTSQTKVGLFINYVFYRK
jgi:hypothetical protein